MGTALLRPGTVSLGKRPGAPDQVLVQLFFPGSKVIPAGIPQRVRPLDEVAHCDHIVASLPDLQPAMLWWGGLTNAGYALADHYWFWSRSRENGHHPKAVVHLTFSRADDTSGQTPIPRQTVEILYELARTTWQLGHVWESQNGVRQVTVVLMGRNRWDGEKQQYSPLRHALVVRKGTLCAIPVWQGVAAN